MIVAKKTILTLLRNSKSLSHWCLLKLIFIKNKNNLMNFWTEISLILRLDYALDTPIMITVRL